MDELKTITVHFSETAEEEVIRLWHEFKLIPMAEALQSDDVMTEELDIYFKSMIVLLNDLFSTEVPPEEEPEVALRKSSRDINLSKLLRERGVFRMYRLTNTRNKDGVLWFMTVTNPDTGEPFAVQEDLIGWFCENAHVSRGFIYQRLAAIKRLVALGYDLEEAFKTILSKPFVIQSTLKEIAMWDKETLIGVDPDVAIRMANKVSPENAEMIKKLAEASRVDPDAKEELRQLMIPVIGKLIDEVAEHERAGDASKFIKHDILMRPEITYSWDEMGNALIIKMEKRTIDLETGEEEYLGSVTVPFVPDAIELPPEIIRDLIKRLPIKNRTELDYI